MGFLRARRRPRERGQALVEFALVLPVFALALFVFPSWALVLIFIAVLLLVEGLYLTVFGKSISLNSRVNRRLDMLEKGAGREQVLEQLRKEMSQHMKSRKIPLYSLLASKAQKAAIAFSPQQLILLMLGLSAAAFFALFSASPITA